MVRVLPMERMAPVPARGSCQWQAPHFAGKMYLCNMKQLLFISAGKAFPEGAFAFLQFLRQQESFHVKGLFFSPLDYNGIYSASHVPGSNTYVRTKDKERQAVAEHKSIFARRCEQANIHFHLHENDEPCSKH